MFKRLLDLLMLKTCSESLVREQSALSFDRSETVPPLNPGAVPKRQDVEGLPRFDVTRSSEHTENYFSCSF
jgi:hypothetical protein